MGILETSNCPRWQEPNEDLYHFFWGCPISQKVYGWIKNMIEKYDKESKQTWSYKSVILNIIQEKSYTYCKFLSVVC